MSFFLISLLGTMILLVYSQTISKYDDKRLERKAYILVNNIHQEFMSNPRSFYYDNTNDEITSSAGIKYYDEFLREAYAGDAFMYRVFYSVIVSEDLSYVSLYIANIEAKGKDVITSLSLGKMRIT